MPNEIMPADDIKTLVEFYKDNVAYQRHHEDIRFKGSQLIVAMVGGLLAVSKLANLGNANYAIAIFIMLLGFLGIAEVLKHSERADRHARIARAYRYKISEFSFANGGSSVEGIHDIGVQRHREKAWWVIRKMRARWFWLALHVGIVLLGAALAFMQCKGWLNNALTS